MRAVKCCPGILCGVLLLTLCQCKTTERFPDKSVKTTQVKYEFNRPIGKWLQPIKDGLSVSVDSNGVKVSDCVYKNDMLNGPCRFWWPNSQLMALINYENDDAQGASLGWYDDGSKRDSSYWVDNQLTGLTIDWHRNGQKRSKCNHKNGKIEGELIQWDKNGRKLGVCIVKDGLPVEGVTFDWWNSGGMKSRTRYANGALNGEQVIYNEEGRRMLVQTYVDGSLQGPFTAYINGVRIEGYNRNGEWHGRVNCFDISSGRLASYCLYEGGVKGDCYEITYQYRQYRPQQYYGNGYQRNNYFDNTW